MTAVLTDRLSGRVALITGGARGQGAAHAHRLAGEGATVLIADVLDAEGAVTEKELRANGFTASYLHLDVSDPASWQVGVRADRRAVRLPRHPGQQRRHRPRHRDRRRDARRRGTR